MFSSIFFLGNYFTGISHIVFHLIYVFLFIFLFLPPLLLFFLGEVPSIGP